MRIKDMTNEDLIDFRDYQIQRMHNLVPTDEKRYNTCKIRDEILTRMKTKENEMSKFNVGDVVYLNSGSPPMTVMGILKGAASERYDCSWKRVDGTVAFTEFDVECIRKKENEMEFKQGDKVKVVFEGIVVASFGEGGRLDVYLDNLGRTGHHTGIFFIDERIIRIPPSEEAREKHIFKI